MQSSRRIIVREGQAGQNLVLQNKSLL
jgi:hypothetical protein